MADPACAASREAPVVDVHMRRWITISNRRLDLRVSKRVSISKRADDDR
jgi:hypothetical protein